MARTKLPPVFWRHPALPFVEGRQSCDSKACYRAHTHPTLSVGAIDRGGATMRLPGHSRRLQVGDVVVIGPGVVHSCNPLPHRRWSYRMFYFDPVWLRSILATDSSSPGLMEFNGILRTPRATAVLNQITDLLARPPSPRPRIGWNTCACTVRRNTPFCFTNLSQLRTNQRPRELVEAKNLLRCGTLIARHPARNEARPPRLFLWTQVMCELGSGHEKHHPGPG